MQTIYFFQSKKNPNHFLPWGAASSDELNSLLNSSPIYKDFNVLSVTV